MNAVNPYIETAPVMFRPQRVGDEHVGALGQPRVGVQEKQCVGGCVFGARVHLAGPTPRRQHHLVCKRRCNGPGVVGAAAIHNNHFNAALAQRHQRSQPRCQGAALIEHRHHDAQRAASHAPALGLKAFMRPMPFPAH